MSDERTAATAATAEKQIIIQKLYLKDASFEAPNTPGIYGREWQPKIELNIQTKNNVVGEDLHDVVLTVTANAKVGDDVAFLIEIQQAGVFLIKGFTADETRQIIGAYCPNLLFPFAREAATDFVTKGGFPGLLLQPINFDALYMKQMEQVAQASQQAPGAEEQH